MLQVVPVVAIGDILVEIRLVRNNTDALKVLPCTSVAHACPQATATDLTIVIDPAVNPFLGFTNIANCPWAIGMQIGLIDAAGDIIAPDGAHTLSGIAQNNNTGAITLTFDNGINAGEAGEAAPRVVILTGTDAALAVAAATRFVVKRADLLLNIVRPPDQYIQSIMGKVQEGLTLDLNSYTTYRATLQTAIKTQTIEIPCFVSRARAVFSIPRIQDNAILTINNATDRNLNGQHAGAENWRWQVGTVYYPNQPVELDHFLGGFNFSAQAIVELEKAMVSANIPVRSLLKVKQNFVIARALAKHG